METYQRYDIAAGIGYNDGLVREVALPKLWRYWDAEARLYYLAGYGIGWKRNWTKFWEKICR